MENLEKKEQEGPSGIPIIPEKKSTRKIICSWCQKEIGTEEGKDGITHGICPECKDKMQEELEKDKE